MKLDRRTVRSRQVPPLPSKRRHLLTARQLVRLARVRVVTLGRRVIPVLLVIPVRLPLPCSSLGDSCLHDEARPRQCVADQPPGQRYPK